MGFFKEFKEFAMKGNVVDMAVGVIIGAAFGAIVNSLVNDIFTPVIGVIANSESLSNYSYNVVNPLDGKLIVAVAYGKFLDAVIKFIIVAFCLFLVIKVMNSAKRKQAAAPPAPETMTKEQLLLTEIRDALLKQKAS